MKTIGLLGGMSWESTALYYRLINEDVRQRLGGLHSAPILLLSVDFQPVETLQQAGEWDTAGEILATAARQVEAGGADLLLLCTNTMHRVAPQIEAAISIPFLHLADATAERVLAAGIDTVGLLGTRFTMEQDFYRGRLEARGLTVVVPAAPERELVHQVIYDELCLGRVEDASRQTYVRIMDDLVASGAKGMIAGCTEIGMLVGQDNTSVPFFDTTAIHARAAVDAALS